MLRIDIGYYLVLAIDNLAWDFHYLDDFAVFQSRKLEVLPVAQA